MIKKRGQVTIFIIVAVIVVAVVALFFAFAPKLGIEFGNDAQNPQDFIQTCVEDDLNDVVTQISMQGGSLNPELYFEYNNIPVSYLVYSSEYGFSGTLQQPLLREHIKQELKDEIYPTIQNCFTQLKSSYENKNYGVSINPGEIGFQILPKRVLLNLNYSVTLSKENTETYEEFYVVVDNNLYELLDIVINMIEFLSNPNYCNIEPNLYMIAYPAIKVEEPVLSNDIGAHIEIITQRESGNKFQFAWRSCAIAPGY